jgi:quinol monooxygenase YgiN
MSETSEVMALAVVEAFDGHEEECLHLLRDFYAVLRRKQYSRDLLYRDQKNAGRFINIRYWRSAEAAAEAQEDPDVHRFWKRLSEIGEVTAVYERLEDVTPHDSIAERQG